MSHLGLADNWGKCSKAVDALFTWNTTTKCMERDYGKYTVVQVFGKYLGEVIDVIGRGECGSTKTAPDPMLDWVYNGVREKGTFGVLPEEPTPYRQAWFTWMAEYTAYFGCSRGGTYALVDKASGKVVAAAITCPPKCTPFSKSYNEMGINIRKAGMMMA